MRNLANGHISLLRSAGLWHLETQKILDAMQTGLRVKIGPSSRTEGLLKHLTYKGRIENQPGTTQRSLILPPKNYFSDSIEKP